jgi:hypothetical protein
MEHDRNLAPHTKSVSAPAGPTRWGKILNPITIAHLFLPTTPTAMIERSDLSSSNRSLSASSLKDRLSKLTVTPLRPVAALQARVKCVHSIPARLVIFFAAGLSPPFNSHPPLCLQFCPSEHPSGAPAPDGLGCIMDQHDSGLHGPDPIPPVRAFLDPIVRMARATTDIRRRRWHAARTHLCGHS